MRMRKVDFVVQHPCHHPWDVHLRLVGAVLGALDSDEVKDLEVTFGPGSCYSSLRRVIRGRLSLALGIRWGYWEAKTVVRVISPLDAIISSTVVSLTDSAMVICLTCNVPFSIQRHATAL